MTVLVTTVRLKGAKSGVISRMSQCCRGKNVDAAYTCYTIVAWSQRTSKWPTDYNVDSVFRIPNISASRLMSTAIPERDTAMVMAKEVCTTCVREYHLRN